MFETITPQDFQNDLDDFSYGAGDTAALRLRAAVFAERVALREQMRVDAQAAGLHVTQIGTVTRVLEDDAAALGDVILIDCPQADGASLAALARLDLRAARLGAALVVSTSVAALDDVFGCFSQSNPQILVAPSRAERLVALGQVLARMPGRRVRELSDEDRLMLLRLTQQVNEIGEKLAVLSPAAGGSAAGSSVAGDTGSAAGSAVGAFRFDAPAPAAARGAGDNLVVARNTLPDPRMVRRIIRQRQMRARFFDGDLFADPAWDMLLDLTAAKAENAKVSVTSLCIASGVPPTTALRWIGQMTEGGLLQRIEDETDRRCAFITLTDKASEAMAGYFAEIGNGAPNDKRFWRGCRAIGVRS